MSETKYAVVIKSDKYEETPDDWKCQIKGMEGVSIDADTYPDSIRVSATEKGLEVLESSLGEYLIVEEFVAHFTQPDVNSPSEFEDIVAASVTDPEVMASTALEDEEDSVSNASLFSGEQKGTMEK